MDGMRMSEQPTDPRIDRMTIVHIDGAVYARCYSGRNFTDALLSPGCLANIVADGARVLQTLLSEQTSAELSAKAV